MSQAGLECDLRRLVGDAVSVDPAARRAAGTDFVTRRGVPAAVVTARSADDVAAVAGYAGAHGVPLVPRGAATNLAAGIAPGEDAIVLDVAGLDAIRVDGRVAEVGPGALNGAVKAAAAATGLTYAPDPASAPISSIGGNIACNAGGPCCLKYGVTFHHVHAVDVALSDGRVMTYTDGDDVDVLGVMIGSEGLLGVVTRAELRLIELPAARWTAPAAFDDVRDAAATVAEVLAAGVLPAALELCDARAMEVFEANLPSGYPVGRAAMLIAELDGDADAVADDARVLEPVLRARDPELRVAAGAAEREALWAGRLAAGFALRRHGGGAFYVCDATVPLDRMPEMIVRGQELAAAHGLDVVTLAHAGDGNLHPVVFWDGTDVGPVDACALAVAEAALELGGTLTGEHGIGTAKRAQMTSAFGPVELAAFRAIKDRFDPAGVMNPGVMLPPPGPRQKGLGAFFTTPGIDVDAINLAVSAGGAATCRDALAAVRAAGLDCPALDAPGTVAELVEQRGHRAPVRGALLGLDVELPDGGQARFGGATMKDVAGLDAKRLVAGGRGERGRVLRARLRAVPVR